MLNYFSRTTVTLVGLVALVGGCVKYQTIASKETIDKLATTGSQTVAPPVDTEAGFPCTLTARAKTYECRLGFTNEISCKIDEYGLSEFCRLLGSHLAELMGQIDVPKPISRLKVKKLDSLRQKYLLERAEIINDQADEKPENNDREFPLGSKLAVVR
ncbi:hypothetical protein HYV88_05930 [Candidatus Woesearchaeota archaeon]|nr:hypothetical protein [Candidatus Woesearchaeota archaeon]